MLESVWLPWTSEKTPGASSPNSAGPAAGGALGQGRGLLVVLVGRGDRLIAVVNFVVLVRDVVAVFVDDRRRRAPAAPGADCRPGGRIPSRAGGPACREPSAGMAVIPIGVEWAVVVEVVVHEAVLVEGVPDGSPSRGGDAARPRRRAMREPGITRPAGPTSTKGAVGRQSDVSGVVTGVRIGVNSAGIKAAGVKTARIKAAAVEPAESPRQIRRRGRIRRIRRASNPRSAA